MPAATRQLQAWTPVFRLSPERGLLTVSRPCLSLVLPSWSGAAVAYLFVTADSPRQAVLSPGVGRPVLDVRVAHAVRLVLMRARLVPVSGSAGGSASRPAPLRTKGRLVRAPVVLGIITAVLQQALRVLCQGPGVPGSTPGFSCTVLDSSRQGDRASLEGLPLFSWLFLKPPELFVRVSGGTEWQGSQCPRQNSAEGRRDVPAASGS